MLDSLVRPDVPMVMLNGNLDKVCGEAEWGEVQRGYETYKADMLHDFLSTAPG